MVLSAAPKKGPETISRPRCDLSVVTLAQFEMHSRSGLRFAVKKKRVLKSTGPFGPHPVADAKGAAEWAGKAKQRLGKAYGKKKGQLIFLPLFYSAVELDWQPVFCVHRQTGSFLFPSNADASGTTRLAAPVSAERLSAQIDFFFLPHKVSICCTLTDCWLLFFFIFYFSSFACLVKSDTDKERLGQRSWRARCKKSAAPANIWWSDFR